VLAGDAAGMVEPFTGEGIGYALQSGCIAAEVLLQHLDGHLPDMQAYQRRVDAEILPELRRAYALARVARRVPRLTYLAFVHLPRFRNLVYGLMRGERSFGCASPKLRPVEPLLRRLEP
jgi:flavin-dependent dehydrogenase